MNNGTNDPSFIFVVPFAVCFGLKFFPARNELSPLFYSETAPCFGYPGKCRKNG